MVDSPDTVPASALAAAAAGVPADARPPDTGVRAFILQVDECLTPLETIRDACILCRDGVIAAVGGASAFVGLDDLPRLHCPGCTAIPGLVDTHIHGAGGYDALRADVNPDVSPMSLTLAAHGITSFVPTVLSATPARLLEVVHSLAGLCHDAHPGAVPIGIHLEGPFINQQKRGSQNAAAIRAIDLGEARDLLAAANGKMRIMTLAPELERAELLINLLREHGVAPSMGHSLADEAATLRAVDAGATRCTHFYNGMPQLGQRDVALTAVALTDDRITIELIADGVHVHPRMVDLACRAKPRGHVVGTSDAATGAGLADGFYEFGGDQVQIADGSCRRVSDGRLAGSCMTLDRALRNFRAFVPELKVNEAIACFTLAAARSIGFQDRGLIQPGRRADIAILDPEWNVVMTVVNGRIVYDREGWAAHITAPPVNPNTASD